MNFNKFNGIILSEGTEKRNVDNQLISEDRNNEIEIIKIQEWFNIFQQRIPVEIINNELIKKIELNIRKNKINYSFLIKRIFEFIFSFFFLIISSPLLIIASILIYMEDKGPIFILNYEWVKMESFYNMEAAINEGQCRKKWSKVGN